MRDAEWFMEHPDEFDVLSQEDQAKVFAGASLPEGETATAESGEAPASTEDEKAGEGEKQPEVEAEAAKEEPVVQAKDGKHTIPYSELEKARDDARRYEQMAKEQATLIADLQAAKERDNETGGTEEQEKVLAEYQGEFPEVFQDMAPHLKKMVDPLLEEIKALKADFAAKVKPLEEVAAKSAEEAHFAAIAAKHSDFREIASESTFQPWLDSQPSFVRRELERVLANGTAPEVIELLDAYRVEHPSASSPTSETKAPSKEDLAKVAAEKAAKAKPKTPVSLSDIPGGTAAHHDEAEAMRELSSGALLGKFNGMSPKQIEAAVSRLL